MILLEQFDNLLAEELSIAKSVYIDARNISQMLRKEINITKSSPFNMDGIEFKYGIFVYPISFQKELKIVWKYYNFYNEQFFKLKYFKIPYNNSFNEKTNQLNITVFAIGGKIENRTVEDTVMHEIEHLYQHTKKNDDFLKTDKDKIAYHNASVNKQNPNNNATMAIGDIFYFSKEFEQDAQVNGVYGYMMKEYKENGIPPSLSYKKTDAYSVLIKLKLITTYGAYMEIILLIK